MTAAERTDRAQEPSQEIGLIKASVLRELCEIIPREAPRDVPVLALAAFCGMRTGEVHGQRWEDFDWERKFLRVTVAKPRTPARRQVPLCETALAWLAPYRQAAGAVSVGAAVYRVRRCAAEHGLTLAENGFWHTWISARAEITGDLPRTAIEAGTSVSMMHRHYRNLLTREEALAWFSVLPPAV